MTGERLVSLRVFGCLPVTARGAARRQASEKPRRRKPRGEYVPAAVSVYGDLRRGCARLGALGRNWRLEWVAGSVILVGLRAVGAVPVVVKDLGFGGCGYRKSYPGWRRCRDGLSSLRDARPLEAAQRIARRTVQIACGSRGRNGISPPAACRPEAVGASEAQAAPCRSPDLRLALSAVPFRARSRGCLQA